MDDTWDALIRVLSASVEKHGEKPLTNKWLLNIMRRAERQLEAEERLADLEAHRFDAGIY